MTVDTIKQHLSDLRTLSFGTLVAGFLESYRLEFIWQREMGRNSSFNGTRTGGILYYIPCWSRFGVISSKPDQIEGLYETVQELMNTHIFIKAITPDNIAEVFDLGLHGLIRLKMAELELELALKNKK